MTARVKLRMFAVEINGHQIARHSFEGKTCAACQRLLPLSSFYRRGAGHHSYCKPCHNDRSNELRATRRSRAARLRGVFQ